MMVLCSHPMSALAHRRFGQKVLKATYVHMSAWRHGCQAFECSTPSELLLLYAVQRISFVFEFPYPVASGILSFYAHWPHFFSKIANI